MRLQPFIHLFLSVQMEKSSEASLSWPDILETQWTCRHLTFGLEKSTPCW